MPDVYAQAIKESDLTKSQQRQEQKELTEQLRSYNDSLKKGDRFVNMGKNVEAAHAYIEAICKGAPENLIDPRFKRIAKQLEAKGTDMTRTERRVLYDIGAIGESYIHEHKKEHVFNISPVHSTAVAVIAIAAVVLGTLGIAIVARPTGYALTGTSSGDSSMILAAFILLALLYFYLAKPKK